MGDVIYTGRSGRQRWSFLNARLAARQGERVLICTPNAESAWKAWIEFTKDAVVGRNDDATRTTTFPGGGTLRIFDGMRQPPEGSKPLTTIIDDLDSVEG